MSRQADLEVLQAVLAVAGADGELTRSEKGVYESLARRIGADAVTVWTMMNNVRTDPSLRDKLFTTKVGDPKKAMKLLVATARIDGEISDQERELLVDISTRLGIDATEFGALYREGLAAADEIRRRS
ncbi:MAG: hypothetical protein IID40_04250 [Planctomycetes bacterium]|nr:hypothetical protein [Planctomycetota bacterium]